MIHKDLDVWKKSIDFVTEIYEITRAFPKDEIYGLTSQIRRAAVSIPSNIAEGSARNSNKEFIQFLYISLGSLSEVDTQMIISEKIGYISDITKVIDSIEQIRRMLLGLIKYLKQKK